MPDTKISEETLRTALDGSELLGLAFEQTPSNFVDRSTRVSDVRDFMSGIEHVEQVILPGGGAPSAEFTHVPETGFRYLITGRSMFFESGSGTVLLDERRGGTYSGNNDWYSQITGATTGSSTNTALTNTGGWLTWFNFAGSAVQFNAVVEQAADNLRTLATSDAWGFFSPGSYGGSRQSFESLTTGISDRLRVRAVVGGGPNNTLRGTYNLYRRKML